MKLYTAHVDEGELFSLLDGLKLLYKEKVSSLDELGALTPQGFAAKSEELKRLVQLHEDLNALSPDEEVDRENM